MTLDQIIAIGASISAALSALATFLTVRQIVKQRQASYRPELVFERQFFTLYSSAKENGGFPDEWSVVVPQAPDIHDSDVRLRLRNIGLGAAKRISLHWSFDIEKAVDDFNKSAQKAMAGAYIELNSVGFMTIKVKSGVAQAIAWINEKKVDLDYIVPSMSDSAAVTVNVPLSYMTLFALRIYCYSVNREINNISNIGPIFVRLDYYDIGEKVYSIEYKIEPNIILVDAPATEIRGFFSVSRVPKSSISLSLAREIAPEVISIAVPGISGVMNRIADILNRNRSNR